jgi:DNA-binding beta-propeller fold protein YncE
LLAFGVALLALLALAIGVSLAAQRGFDYQGCIADAGANGCAVPTHDSLDGADGIAVSPDGKNAYVASYAASSSSRFLRAADGSLTFEGCFADAGANGCANPAHDSLEGADGAAVSADGKNVYLASFFDSSISGYDRASDGSLSNGHCIANAGTAGCVDPAHDSLDGATGVVVSPDGNNVYVASYVGDSISSFDRAANGALTYTGCIANAGANGCGVPTHDSLGAANGVAISSDGKSVYVASVDGDSISRLSRATDGTLTYKTCFANGGENGCDDPAHDSLDGAVAVAVSPNGESVYVASKGGNSISGFDRATNGSLSNGGCIADAGASGCVDPAHDSLDGASGVAVSPNGKSVYVASAGTDGVSSFDRAGDGSLSPERCIANAGAGGCVDPAHDSLDGASGVAVSPDGESVYVAGFNSKSVTTLETPPKTKLESSKISSAKRKATFKFSSNEAGSTFKCKLDQRGFKKCDSPKTYRHLDKGRHTFKVKAKNSSGGVDPSPAKKKFKIHG